MEYELINPSDPYTFIADDLETAALVVFAISNLYGAKVKDGDEGVPVFIFGGAEEWYTEQFGREPDEGLKAKKERVAAALRSMVLGALKTDGDMKRHSEAITDPDRREKFIAKWQDGRSSMNDIGAYCHKLAEELATHKLL